jgi:hypothetical protein
MVWERNEVRMRGKTAGLSYGTMKWGLFAALVAVAPAPVVVFDSFMTGPVIFVAANVVSLTWDALGAESAAGVEIVGYFVVHLVIYVFLYGLAASAAAKGLSLIDNRRARAGGFVALVASIAMVGVLPLYGGAGIHRGAWGSIAFFFGVLDRSHFGPTAVVTIYGPAVLVLGAVLGAVWWAGHKSARGEIP